MTLDLLENPPTKGASKKRGRLAVNKYRVTVVECQADLYPSLRFPNLDAFILGQRHPLVQLFGSMGGRKAENLSWYIHITNYESCFQPEYSESRVFWSAEKVTKLCSTYCWTVYP